MVETPWKVTLTVTLTSLPFAVLGMVIVQKETPLRIRPVARSGAVPTRAVHATVPVASAAPLSPRVTLVPTANALPAEGLAGVAVMVEARSVSGFVNVYLYASVPSGAVSSAMKLPLASSWKLLAQKVKSGTPPRSALLTLNVATPLA